MKIPVSTRLEQEVVDRIERLGERERPSGAQRLELLRDRALPGLEAEIPHNEPFRLNETEPAPVRAGRFQHKTK